MSVSAGVISLISVGSTVDALEASLPTGGTTPYSYQWYKSTSNGFVPSTSTLVAGATSLILNDTGLTPATNYYYVMVVKDSAATPTSASYAQFNVATVSGKLNRLLAQVFGINSGFQQMAEYGSFAAGTPVYSTDPSVIQSLSAWLEGWFGAVVGSNNACIEDMNAVCCVISYMVCYALQSGIPDYNSSSNYYNGSICNSLGQIFVSLADNNQGNTLLNGSFWKAFGGGTRTVTTNTTLANSDDILRSNSTAGNLTHTLPAILTVPVGKRFTIKDVGTGGFATTVQANGSDTIDGNTIYVQTLTQYDALTLVSNGTSWDVI